MEDLTKSQAIQAMVEGKKVRHRYFSPYEWMKMRSTTHFIFEDGVICTFDFFWQDRFGKDWETGWSIIPE
jgi:hypothetical protein